MFATTFGSANEDGLGSEISGGTAYPIAIPRLRIYRAMGGDSAAVIQLVERLSFLVGSEVTGAGYGSRY